MMNFNSERPWKAGPANKLMVVAHPDDEALFGGAQLIQESGWKVVCVTNGLNPVRKQEFHTVMHDTHSQFEIWDYPDEEYTALNMDTLREDLRGAVNEQEWDKIVSHNEDGEYGHLHHKQIHELMKELVSDSLWVFSFGGPELSEDAWKLKLAILSTYLSQKTVIDNVVQGVQNIAGYKTVNVRQETILKAK